MNPFISIVIPAYNRAAYLREAVESCLVQDYKYSEIIVVDDGSTDNSRDTVEDYISSGRVSYHWQVNQGRSIARNEGASKARGEYLLFLDSDDLLAKDSLTALAALAVDYPASGAIGGLVRFFPEHDKDTDTRYNYTSSVFDHQFTYEPALRFFLNIGAYMVKKDLFFQTGKFKPVFEPAEDLDFSIGFLLANKVTWSATLLVVYKRRHASNTDDTRLHEASYNISMHHLRELEHHHGQAGRKMLISDFYARAFNNCVYLSRKRKGTLMFLKAATNNPALFFSMEKLKMLFFMLLKK